MANGTVQFAGTFSYGAPGGVAVSEQVSASAPFNNSSVGIVDVPASAMAAAAFPIPVGDITSILAIYVENKTGQDVTLKLNATALTLNIPTGSKLLYFTPAAPAANPWTAITFTLTTGQVADGQIAYRVFGN